MNSHARTQTMTRSMVVGATVVAVVAALVRAVAADNGVTGVLALVTLSIAGFLGALLWRPRGPVVVGHFAAGAITVLAILLVGGFVLAAIRVDLDTRSTSIYLSILALLLGVGAEQHRSRATSGLSLSDRGLADDRVIDVSSAQVSRELEDALGHTQWPDGRIPNGHSRTARVAIAAVVGLLAAGAVVLSYVSADKAADREAFVALSTVSSRPQADSRKLTIQIANHRESYSQYALAISGAGVNKRMDVTVREDTTETLDISVPKAAIVTVTLYRNDHPTSVYRQTRSLPPTA